MLHFYERINENDNDDDDDKIPSHFCAVFTVWRYGYIQILASCKVHL